MKIYRRIFGILTIIGLFWSGFGPIRAETEAAAGFYPHAAIRSFDDYLEQAGDAYVDSGMAAYRAAKTLLWTETVKRCADLQPSLPAVNPGTIQACRKALWEAMQEEPRNLKALILAGHYLLWKGQYDSALWNYRQALQISPDSLEARLALADFFLTRWEPDQAILLLKQQEIPEMLQSDGSAAGNGLHPEIALRIGAAYLQKNEYYLAAVYLSQADPLPLLLQPTRKKDLAKALMGMGDFSRAKQLLLQPSFLQQSQPKELPLNQSHQQADSPLEPEKTLLREYLGWASFAEGDSGEAEKYWERGRTENANYRLYNSVFLWLKADQALLALADPAVFKNDSDLNAQLNLSQGMRLLSEKQTNQAYESLLAGIKADRRSLIGFLEAARCQLLRKNYGVTVNLCNQGLAVNPLFKPLLELRAAAYLKQGKREDAGRDQVLYKSIPDQDVKSPKLSGHLSKTAQGVPYFAIQGETKNLSGIWWSPDGSSWQYQPWWGGPVFLKKAWPKIWVLPAGPNLSGEALFIQMKAQSKQSLPGLAPLLTAPLVNLSVPWIKQDIKYELVCSRLLTNRRELQLTLNQAPNSGKADYMAVSEKGGNGSWRKFTKDFSYTVSPGDGLKEIVVKLADQYGNSAEIKTEVTLDTSHPEVRDLQTEFGSDTIKLYWRVNKPCQSRIEIFTRDGVWRQIEATPDGEQRFQAQIPRYRASFCRIISQDEAGNQAMYPVMTLIKVLQADIPWHFRIASLSLMGGYQNVTIQPAEEFSDQWAVSNDLYYWSGWKQGDGVVRWRTRINDGIGLIFIQIRSTVTNVPDQKIALPVLFQAKTDSG